MSKTDKTRPYWVQVRDPSFSYKLYPHHFCRNRDECDLYYPMPVTRRDSFRKCELWPRWRVNDKMYGRNRWHRTHPGQEGGMRMDLRRLRSKWKKAYDIEDIDSKENLPTQRWLWKRWYWD